MNCLIVDSNQVTRNTIKDLITQAEDMNLVGECTDAIEAYGHICTQPIDIVFLDVEIPEMNGLDLIRQVTGKKPIIIFVSAKKDYATDAYELNAADYIVKPFTAMRFFQAIEKAREIYYHNKKEDSTGNTKDFVFIRDSGMLRRLIIDEIQFIEATGDYVKIITRQRSHSIHTTLKKMEEKLPPQKFQRVHRSYIVALNKIESIEDGVLVINNNPVPVAALYRDALARRLNILQ